MSTPFPMLHVVVKDGKITGTHDEPCQLDGVASVPYAAIEPSPAPVQPDTSNSLESGGIEKLAHRIAWRYKHSNNPQDIEYTFNADTLHQFVQAAIEAAVLAERERCAALVSEIQDEEYFNHIDYGDRIRKAVKS